jgi:precorrin-6B methylase 2
VVSSPQSYQRPLTARDNDASPAQPPAQPERARVTGDLPVKEHILMVNDLFRGEKYLDAMKAKIRPGDVVLEVGTGAGLLTCLAARLGAKHVYTVEQSPALYQIAGRTVATNGLSDQVTLINANSRELQTLGIIKEPIDVFVTETIGTQGLDEGIINVFADVKPLLAPQARVIPETVQFKHCLLNMSGIREQLEVMEPILGVDMGALNEEVRSNNHFWMSPIEMWREISTTASTPVFSLLDFELQECTQTMQITRDSMCDGLLNWSEFCLGPNNTIETRYRHYGNSWANSLYLMTRCRVLRSQTCTSTMRINDDRISWVLNWTINAPK